MTFAERTVPGGWCSPTRRGTSSVSDEVLPSGRQNSERQNSELPGDQKNDLPAAVTAAGAITGIHPPATLRLRPDSSQTLPNTGPTAAQVGWKPGLSAPSALIMY